MCAASGRFQVQSRGSTAVCVWGLTIFPLSQVLNVERNQLTHLPRSVGKLSQLQTLNVKGRSQEARSVGPSVSSVPASILLGAMEHEGSPSPAVTIHWTDLLSVHLSPW